MITNNIFFKIFALLLLLSIPIHAQQNSLWKGKQAYNWAFGDSAGLNFESGQPVSQLTPVNTLEGSAAISSPQGELLFYAASNTLYNKDGEVMLNGNDITGFGMSSSQAGVIVPKPGSSNIYYAFGVPGLGDFPADFAYSEVDMNLDFGKGGVTQNKNITLYGDGFIAEKITAVNHANGTDVWVIIHAIGSNEFLAYLVTENGVTTTPVISATGLVYDEMLAYDYGAGQLKASPDGTKLATGILGAFVGMDKGLEIFDFDAATGVVSNPVFIEAENGVIYTLEFSPNSQYVYVAESTFAWLLFINPIIKQYDVTAGDQAAIQDSMVVVADLTGSMQYLSCLQLAPDGRIYSSNFSNLSMSCLRYPNNKGEAAGLEINSVYIQQGGQMIGLPTFNQTYFESGIEADGYCTNQPITFTTVRIPDITSITWNFGDPESGEANISNEPYHVYSAPGIYTVTAEITSNNSVQIASIEIEVIPGPYAAIPSEELRSQCAGTDGTATFDLTLLESVILNGQSTQEYAVAFYASESDYSEDITIINPFEFITTGQTVYAAVSGGVNDCVTLINFDLIVNQPPVVSPLPEVERCGNVSGFALFNLRQFDPQLVEGQNMELFDINYYTDSEGTIIIEQADSFNSQGSVIYAKVINIATGCSSIVPVNLIAAPVNGLTTTPLLGCSPFDLTLVEGQFFEEYSYYYYETEEDALNDSRIANPDSHVVNNNNGSVYVVAQDVNGCFYAGLLSVGADGCFIPRGISPNNDDLNDNFDLSGFAVSQLAIFNRYGIKVYSYNNYVDQWHGQDSNGQELPTGPYYYSIQLTDGQEKTGWVYLNRETN